jgi:CO/xanthine dehydrogenase Mo-binding subunit
MTELRTKEETEITEEEKQLLEAVVKEELPKIAGELGVDPEDLQKSLLVRISNDGFPGSRRALVKVLREEAERLVESGSQRKRRARRGKDIR